MENDLILKGLYPINTNNYDSDLDFIEKTILIIKSGIKIFQFRGKYLSFKRKKYLIKKIYENCQKNEVQLIINDDYNLVKYFEGSGLHIGQSDIDLKKIRKYFGNKIIIGKSCYDSVEMGVTAEKDGASYVSFGAMYKTKSKKNFNICDSRVIISAKKNLKIPICLIGGININNIKDIIRYNPNMISMISGIYDYNNILLNIKKINEMIKV
jgi:thiamine-phosphate pyrophosphorylase